VPSLRRNSRVYSRTETLLELGVPRTIYVYSFVFHLIYFTARNVKGMLFEKRREKFV